MALLSRTAGSASVARAVSAQRPRLALAPAFTRPQRLVVARAEAEPAGSVDGEKLMKDLQEKWDKVENKPQVALYAGSSVLVLWLTGTVIGAINAVPLLPKLLELIGLTYSAWFTYRYLLFKANREELIADVEELKNKITGK